jgi:hypothetical protein
MADGDGCELLEFTARGVHVVVADSALMGFALLTRGRSVDVLQINLAVS